MKGKTKMINPAKKPNKLILLSGMTLLVIVSVIVGAMFYGQIYTSNNVIERQIIKQGELSFVEKELLLGKYSVFIEVPESSEFYDDYISILEEFTPLEYNEGNASFVFVEETNETIDKITLKGKYDTLELTYFDRDRVGLFICENLHPTVRNNYAYCRIKDIFSAGADELDKTFTEDEIIAILSNTDQLTTREDISHSEERVLLDNNRVILEVYAPSSSKIFNDLVEDILQKFQPIGGYSYLYLIEEKGEDNTRVIIVSKYDETELEEYDSEAIIEYICDHIPIAVSDKYTVC